MKKILGYLMIISILICGITACKKMDSMYKEFIVPGGITYAGKANSIEANSGHNRVKISWLRGADPNVTKAKIFWNYYADSLEISIPATGDTISTFINNLDEMTYSFIVRTYDDKGNASVPVEVIISSYGDVYQESLLNRAVNFNKKSADGKRITIEWGGADVPNGAFATEVKYTNDLGQLQAIHIPVQDSITKILDFMPDNAYQYRTLFRPDSVSIDTFYTDYAENTLMSYDIIPLIKTDWRIVDFYSHFPDALNSVNNVIDGTATTRWHTALDGNFPYYCTVDIGTEETISDVGVWRLTGDESNRGPTKIQFMVSLDNVIWTDLGVFNFNRFVDGEQLYNVAIPLKARYFKFIALAGAFNYMTIGEISLYGHSKF